MNAEDAAYLLELVRDTYHAEAAYRRQLGNGDYIVCLCRTVEESWFLWDFADWHEHRRREKKARAAERSARAKDNAERKARRREEEAVCA